jgi:hypothetical protein
MKGKTTADDVRAAILEKMKIRDLFTKEQRAFYKANAPDGLKLSGLSVLGPINLMKLEVNPDGLNASSLPSCGCIPTARAFSSSRPTPRAKTGLTPSSSPRLTERSSTLPTC